MEEATKPCGLKTEEVTATLEAVDQLGSGAWAKPLLTQAASVLDRLRVGLNDKDAYRTNPVTSAEMSFLFEIRFARALAHAGLTATQGDLAMTLFGEDYYSVGFTMVSLPRAGWRPQIIGGAAAALAAASVLATLDAEHAERRYAGEGLTKTLCRLGPSNSGG
jgi:hypothetical protein